MDHTLVTYIPSEMHWALANAARKLHSEYIEQIRISTDLMKMAALICQKIEAAHIEELAYNYWACQAYCLDAPL